MKRQYVVIIARVMLGVSLVIGPGTGAQKVLHKKKKKKKMKMSQFVKLSQLTHVCPCGDTLRHYMEKLTHILVK